MVGSLVIALLQVSYQCAIFTYCIGDQFIEPYGFSGSLPLLYHYVIIVLFYCGK